MGDTRLLNVCFVSSIVHDDAVVLDGVVHPAFQFLTCDDRTRGIVGITEVDDVHTLVGQGRYEVVLCIAGAIDDVAPSLVGECSCSSAHGIAVHIDGIDGVGHAQSVVQSQDITYVACIALGTIVDEDLHGVQVYASGSEVVLDDGFAQEVVSVFGSVSAEGACRSHFVGGLVQSGYDSRCKRPGYIADAQANDVGIGMSDAEGIDLACNVCKEVAYGELEEVFVDKCHKYSV